MKIVVNTSPLIALDRIDSLDILQNLFGTILRPQSVLDELRAGQHVHGGSSKLFNATWLNTVTDPPGMMLRKELGAGETAAITLAYNLNADLVILDDLAARNVAISLNLKVSGTLGIIVSAYKKGFVTDLEAILKLLKSNGFRVSKHLINNILLNR